jgi:hypothetical protein
MSKKIFTDRRQTIVGSLTNESKEKGLVVSAQPYIDLSHITITKIRI